MLIEKCELPQSPEHDPESLLVHDEKQIDPESCSLQVTECNCKEMGYGAGDAVFASFVVAPLVVGVWRGTWGVMELHPLYFPHAQTYLLGILIHVCFALVRSQLLARSVGVWTNTGSAGRWLRERVLSRFYTYIFILSCIMHWRGGWGLLDATVAAILPNDKDPHRPVLIAAFTILFYISISCLRSSRNVLAPPFFVVTDGKEPTYMFTTRFRVSFVLIDCRTKCSQIKFTVSVPKYLKSHQYYENERRKTKEGTKSPQSPPVVPLPN